MQITPSSGLSPDEVERLIMEAEAAAEKDRKAKEVILQRNRLDSLIKNTRRTLSEFGKGIPAEKIRRMNEVLTQAEEAVSSDDLEVIKENMTKVEEVATELTNLLMTIG
jgi:molecular chaperone DnaK